MLLVARYKRSARQEIWIERVIGDSKIFLNYFQNILQMEKIKISTAQFENKSGDKKYNLGIIEELSAKAAADGSDVIAFHECSISGYSFARHLSKEEMLDVAEFIPDGDSIRKLTRISKKYGITILAGLFEKDEDDKLYNTLCVCG